MPAVAILSKVTKSYGPVRALGPVSLTFEAGRACVLQGPNGSGKSTLLMIVATLSRPTSGKIGHPELGPDLQQVRRALGWVGHESLCYPDLTGRENLRLAGRLHGGEGKDVVDRLVDRTVERFDMGPFVDRPFRTYSRGQRQRVSLARALLHEPRLLLLDEPTTGLDGEASRRLAAIVADELARGAAVITATHDAAFAEAVGGRTIRLVGGRIVSE